MTGGGGTGATAMASGGVDKVAITDGGSGYTMPTVDFDLPDDPNGTQARAHVPADGMDADGTITAVVVDDPGSGYSTAPGVTIHNDTLTDPILGTPDKPLTEATVSSSLKLVGLTVGQIGGGYTSAPDVAITDPTGPGTGATGRATVDVGAIEQITVDTPGAGAQRRRHTSDPLPSVRRPGAQPRHVGQHRHPA